MIRLLKPEDVQKELIKNHQAEISAWLANAITAAYYATGGEGLTAAELVATHPAMLKLRSILQSPAVPRPTLTPQLVGMLFWEDFLNRLAAAGLPIASPFQSASLSGAGRHQSGES